MSDAKNDATVKNPPSMPKQWNPMRDDYHNQKFNQYEHEAGTVPGPYCSKEYTPILMVTHCASSTTTKALQNLFSQYGKVITVTQKNTAFFASFETLADAQTVERRFERNTYGFKVKIKTERPTKPNFPFDVQDLPSFDQATQINYDRTIKLSSHNNPRCFVSLGNDRLNDKLYDDNEKLRKRDPNRWYLLVKNDAHALERTVGALMPNVNTAYKNYKFVTGRGFYVTSPEAEKKFQQRCLSSTPGFGYYDEEKKTFYFTKSKNKKLLDDTTQNLGKCIVCKDPTQNKCSACNSTFYCGVGCQREDWPAHQLICGKSIEKKMPIAPVESFELKMCPPRSGDLVQLTAIIKTNVIFIRSLELTDEMEYGTVEKSVHKAGDGAKKLNAWPSVGDIVIARAEPNNLPQRALVLGNAPARKIKVLYIDYGNVNLHSINTLFQAANDLHNLPCYAIPVLLKGVPEVTMTATVRQYMYERLRRESMIIKYNRKPDDKGPLEVELFDEEKTSSFNDEIKRLCKPTEPDIDELVFPHFLPMAPLPTGTNITLLITDNSVLYSGMISCTIPPYMVEIETFQKDLQAFCESTKQAAYAPRPDEICIAKYPVDDKWYRGQCMEKVGDGYPTICFIDYGNLQPINAIDIRIYPLELIHPIYTHDCEIVGLPEHCSDELIQALVERLPHGEKIVCEEVHQDEEDKRVYKLHLPRMIEELIKLGLIDEAREKDIDKRLIKSPTL